MRLVYNNRATKEGLRQADLFLIDHTLRNGGHVSIQPDFDDFALVESTDMKKIVKVLDEYEWVQVYLKSPTLNVRVSVYRGGCLRFELTPEGHLALEKVRTALNENPVDVVAIGGSLSRERDLDGVCAVLADSAENMKRFRRICKTKMCFVLEGDKQEDGIRTVNLPYSAENKARLLGQFPNIVLIVNEALEGVA